MSRLVESATLLLVLLNPFGLSVYLIGLIHKLDSGTFLRVVLRAALISGAVFVDIVGRVTALVVGTIAVQMILNGWSAGHAPQIGVGG